MRLSMFVVRLTIMGMTVRVAGIGEGLRALADA
jgi:hypothetical protein